MLDSENPPPYPKSFTTLASLARYLKELREWTDEQKYWLASQSEEGGPPLEVNFPDYSHIPENPTAERLLVVPVASLYKAFHEMQKIRERWDSLVRLSMGEVVALRSNLFRALLILSASKVLNESFMPAEQLEIMDQKKDKSLQKALSRFFSSEGIIESDSKGNGYVLKFEIPVVPSEKEPTEYKFKENMDITLTDEQFDQLFNSTDLEEKDPDSKKKDDGTSEK